MLARYPDSCIRTVGSGSKEPNENQVLVLEPGGHKTGHGGAGS